MDALTKLLWLILVGPVASITAYVYVFRAVKPGNFLYFIPLFFWNIAYKAIDNAGEGIANPDEREEKRERTERFYAVLAKPLFDCEICVSGWFAIIGYITLCIRQDGLRYDFLVMLGIASFSMFIMIVLTRKLNEN